MTKNMLYSVLMSVLTFVLMLPLVQAQDRYIYWTDAKDGKILRGDDNGAARETIISARLPSTLDIGESQLYWADKASSTINRSDLSGTITEVILSEIDMVVTMLLDPANRKLYWIEQGAGKIWRANLDGTGVIVFMQGLGRPTALALDTLTSKLYWVDEAAQKIQRANLDVPQVEDVLAVQGVIPDIALDINGGKIYWIANSRREIKRSNLDGSDIETVLSDMTPFDLALDPESAAIYLADVGKIVRFNLNGTGLQELVTGFEIGVDNLVLEFTGGKMYWIDLWTGKMQRANLDGTDLEDVLIAISPPQGVAVDAIDEKLYWTGFGELMRANLDGSDIQYLANVSCGIGQLSAVELDLKEGKMYWVSDTDCGGLQLHRANLDGTNIQSNLLETNQPLSIALDLNERKVYWTNAGNATQFRAIGRANLDGSESETLIDSLNSPGGIAIDPQSRKMYWIDSPGDISRANFDGTDVEVLITGLGFPFDIALDVQNRKMYWTERDPGKIRRANLDGTGIEDLFTDLAAPHRIALTFDSGLVSVDNDTGNINELGQVPTKFLLRQNYPNPFNPVTTISYSILVRGFVTLKIYNLIGKEIRTLVHEFQQAGTYSYSFNANALSSGVYFYRLQVEDDFIEAKKMLLLK